MKPIVIFTYAPAGLGHLRVTDALFHGLPSGTEALLLGAQQPQLTYLHRLTSIHPAMRAVMEWLQRGRPEEIFTRAYLWWLRHLTNGIESQLATIVNQHLEKPRTILVVATHFGLAQQIAAVKDRFSTTHGIELKLVVQVTDDSPQKAWYVNGADLIVVPSFKTKRALDNFGRKEHKTVRIEVVPYPLGQVLTQSLTSQQLEKRQRMFDPNGEEKIGLVLPISGAAVGLAYFSNLIESLERQTDRFSIWIIGRKDNHTEDFLNQMRDRKGMEVMSSSEDREVVDGYEEFYRQKLVGVEITKPSEQAFKALVCPQARGGAILLLSSPVGRQEYDNLNFLERHQLIPTLGQQRVLWSASQHNTSPTQELLAEAGWWRGLRLPRGADQSAQFIHWCLRSGLFAAMLECKASPRRGDEHKEELGGLGVKIFWEKVALLLTEESKGVLNSN